MEAMKRRSFLGALGASTLGLSGCVRASTWAERDGSIWSDDAVVSPSDEPYPTVSVLDVAETPPALDPTVEVTRQFSSQDPATIRVAVTNASDETVEYQLSPSPPWSEYVSEEFDNARIVIIPTENNDHIEHVVPDSFVDGLISGNDDSVPMPPEEPIRSCWTLPGHISRSDATEWVELAPGESVDEEYAIFNTSSAARCLPKGEYRFTADDHFGNGESWGFTVGLHATS